MYKLKQIPQDFIVKEISNVKIEKSGRFLYIKLTKTNINTLDVVRWLSQRLHLKDKKIGFAGSKDKRAVTSQTMSIQGRSWKKIEELDIANVSFEFVGYGNEPISLGDLQGNEFEIVIRNLENEKIENIDYVVNYFDEQRFSKNNAQIGKYIITKKFSEAAALIDNEKCQDHIQNKPKDFIGALKKIPLRLLRMYVNAYQSYLWNEIAARYLGKRKEVEYSLGKFVFSDTHEDTKVPLIGFASKGTIENKRIQGIAEDIMKKEGIMFKDFIIRQIPELSLEGELRDLFVEVNNLKIGEVEKDELNEGKKKVKVSFSLSKGSYATMVVRSMIG